MKKIILLSIALVIALGIVFFALRQTGGNNTAYEAESLRSTLEAVSLSKEAQELDTDGDGLKDWEEILWKTDPGKTDTDSDGTTDNDEIKLGRNPAVKGPSDSLANNPPIKVEAEVSEVSPSTRVIQDFFAEYLALKQDGGTLSEESKDVLIANLVERIGSTGGAPQVYGTNNLTVHESVKISDIKNYGNALGTTFAKNSVAGVEHELVIVQRALQTNDKKELEKLAIIVEAYRKTIADVLLVPVPQNIVSLHLDLLNTMSVVKFDIEGMKSVFTDPLEAIRKISEYQTAVVSLKNSLQNLADYFASKNIIFSKSEAGYMFGGTF